MQRGTLYNIATGTRDEPHNGHCARFFELASRENDVEPGPLTSLLERHVNEARNKTVPDGIQSASLPVAVTR